MFPGSNLMADPSSPPRKGGGGSGRGVGEGGVATSGGVGAGGAVAPKSEPSFAIEQLNHMVELDLVVSSGADGFVRFWHVHDGSLDFEMHPNVRERERERKRESEREIFSELENEIEVEI